ncbi:GerAB/ArcD/ProY family transporter [Salirhabdus sp. Marseille-P4669]|uniref:GerAB/ArcD/ProY family transporter n=1 Tax=Salirhabdus sp. Marseille-P4669 TaxID=2042310 RepID=UPI000C7B18E2|nr:endospore germination permease [Salirhabdus sp. Marseille-P4669]
MIEKGKISTRQFTILVFMFSLGTSVISLPSLVATFAQENAWISLTLTCLLGLLIVYLLIRVSNIDQKKNVFEIMERVFGKKIGKGITSLFLIFLMFLTAANIWQIGMFITTQIMVETPIQVFSLLFIITSLIGVKMGLEVIGRSSEVFFPYAFLSLIIMMILVSPQIDFTNIQPVLQKNVSGIFLSIFPTMATPFFELCVLLAILPYVEKSKEARKCFYIGVVFASILLIAITFMSLAVLGVEFTTRNLFPTYILGKKISIAAFLERIEILVAIAWFFTIYFKITINFYVLSLGLSHLFQLKTPKVLSTPMSFILVVLGAYLGPNVIHYVEYISYYWAPFTATFGLVLPIVILVISKMRKGNKQKTSST